MRLRGSRRKTGREKRKRKNTERAMRVERISCLPPSECIRKGYAVSGNLCGGLLQWRAFLHDCVQRREGLPAHCGAKIKRLFARLRAVARHFLSETLRTQKLSTVILTLFPAFFNLFRQVGQTFPNCEEGGGIPRLFVLQ